MKVYQTGLCVLANDGVIESGEHINSRYFAAAMLNIDDIQSVGDPDFHRKMEQKLKHDQFDFGGRRLRSFASKLLIESVLLSPHCVLNRVQVTSLICLMLKDSDILIVESTASSLCAIITSQQFIQMNKMINWVAVLSICLSLMRTSSSKSGRRLTSIIQLFSTVIQIDDKYSKGVSIESLWKVFYEIAFKSNHFVVQIAAMQSLGIVVHMLMNDDCANIETQSILSEYIAILKKFCNEESPEELRSVCIDSIETSKILRLKGAYVGKYKNEIIDVWLIMISLLQDFEMPLRNTAAKSVSFLFFDQFPNHLIWCIHALADDLCVHYKYLLNQGVFFVLVFCAHIYNFCQRHRVLQNSLTQSNSNFQNFFDYE